MIAVENLSKSYGGFKALDSLDLEVRRGETFGFLGPNGAGKTTTIRILTTLTRPDSGTARIDGHDVTTQPLRVKQLFGVVQQHLSLDRSIRVWEVMELHARLHGIPGNTRRKRIAELLEFVELSDRTRQLVEHLSEGMKRRLMIARALIHRPAVLFLDEPTLGLDVQSRRRLWELVRQMKQEGTTVFLTTHYIEEAEALSNRVGIVDRGKLIALGTPLELRQRLGLVTVETMWNGKVHYQHFRDREAANLHLRGVPAEVKTIVVRDSNLEDVFVEITGRRVEEAP